MRVPPLFSSYAVSRTARLLLSTRWCFGIALAVVMAALCGLPASAQQRVGVNAAVNIDANGTPPGGSARRLIIGQEVVHDERITTDTQGQTQILFLDGSSVSVGPNADLAIDEFVYDPATGTGKMTLTSVQGAIRFVGGRLSKQDNAVNVRLATATLGVRGGVFIADVRPGGKSEIIFVYGKAVTITGADGSSQQLYRPGFAVDVDGGHVSVPHQAPPPTTVSILAQLDGRTGGNGGAATVPTDTTVAASSVPGTISNNLAASVQQANAAVPYVAVPPMPTVTPPQVPQNQIQTTTIQIPPVIVTSITPTVAPAQVPQNQIQTAAIQIPPVIVTPTPTATPPQVPQNQIQTMPSQTQPVVTAPPAATATPAAVPQNQTQTTSSNTQPVVTTPPTSPPASSSAPPPPTVTPRECQYLRWGYWARQVRPWDSSPTTNRRNDFRGTDTWVAGRPTVNMPTRGTASFNGVAIGTVSDNHANYPATGNFNNTYNFGNNTGKITISNFDGRNFSGPVVGARGSASYSGSLRGTNLSGTTSGSFYRPNAAETGGVFSIHSTIGPSYLASGTFSGK
jgi:FecR protein